MGARPRPAGRAEDPTPTLARRPRKHHLSAGPLADMSQRTRWTYAAARPRPVSGDQARMYAFGGNAF